MSTVTVEVDEKWVRIVNSPLYLIVASLTGVSITFAPLFLYWLAADTLAILAPVKWILISICFAVIYLVPLFYIYFSGPVMKQIYKKNK